MKKKKPASNIDNKVSGKKREVSPQLNIDMESKRENWVLNPISTPEYEVDKSPNKIPKCRNYTKDF